MANQSPATMTCLTLGTVNILLLSKGKGLVESPEIYNRTKNAAALCYLGNTIKYSSPFNFALNKLLFENNGFCSS